MVLGSPCCISRKRGPVDIKIHTVDEPPENIIVAMVDLQKKGLIAILWKQDSGLKKKLPSVMI
ncbi:MAG: hypothetical protein CM1200mP10_33250 [Candidatus Neomarinimicrobiota bacterium]|nr:MAG: hypothetical protein CM1200mP10_33250 [Candidatus Neomarinimicrobiota bacterium]